MGPLENILITGASGYLGKNLVKFLLSANYKLILLVRENSNLTYLDSLPNTNKCKVYKIGSADFETIFKENQIDIIIHTAANYGRKGESLSSVIEANLYFPIKLLDAALNHKVKYFINTDTSLPKELNTYSRSKKQFLEWLETLSLEINIINIQLEYFYGPNDDKTKFITFLLDELKSKKNKIDFTDATSLRDFIYIDDVVSAYAAIINKIQEFKGFVNIPVGSGKAIMLKDIIKEVQSITNNLDKQLNFGAIPMRPNEIMKSCADITLLMKLGWQPMFSFEQGIIKTIELETK
ncbi:NAD-dependent epimerase/dehydratase family protein [Pedobacter puniceum]|uniref:NAD-dependent epimerase/dehydratase family protein n=1 Tax=Pedobacter puniceum TaxID=2666136 RepID=A0A7K0FSC2_9SPHI|nr:NAD(P)-dependent oxidoreductase [Pedobacter puniceum]MRX48652.1 NAD-dependent epimerase/dehydratase family protein [Pedobacter puniceum]